MNPLELSYFSLRTERLVEVLFERDHCSSQSRGVTMLCSRVVANNRFYDKSHVSFVEYDGSIDNETNFDDDTDLHSDKRKLGSTVVENELNDSLQLFDSRPNKINTVLKNIGLVSNIEKMYTLHPVQIYYYTHNIPNYSPRNYNLLNASSSVGAPDKNTGEKYNQSYPVQNYNNDRSLTPKNSRYVHKEKRYSFCDHNQKKFPIKFWSMRHMLFSKFDYGIMLDSESFYSVCPEILSYHIAKRCQNDVALDPFCGAGGNIIQLALTCQLVIAIDIDPHKIAFAKQNAEIYGVAEKIEFITGDFFSVSSKLQADVIFMSPPWGGPEYMFDKSFSLESMCKEYSFGGFNIFRIVKNIAPNIAFHMPKTTNIYECLWLARDFGKVEIQQNIVNKKLNSITAFYGEFNDITDNDY